VCQISVPGGRGAVARDGVSISAAGLTPTHDQVGISKHAASQSYFDVARGD